MSEVEHWPACSWQVTVGARWTRYSISKVGFLTFLDPLCYVLYVIEGITTHIGQQSVQPRVFNDHDRLSLVRIVWQNSQPLSMQEGLDTYPTDQYSVLQLPWDK